MRKISKRKLRPRAGSVFEILSGPAVLAIPISLLIFFSLNLDFGIYKTEISGFFPDDHAESVVTFSNIDSKGSNEKLVLFNYKTNASVNAFDANNAFIEAWNLKGFWYELPDFCFADTDGNGLEELFSITISQDDSLFVGQTELNEASIEGKFAFVEKLYRKDGQLDSKIELLGFCDISGDQKEDLIFSLCAGFSHQPRGIYAWDFSKDTIIKSPHAGIAYKYNNQLISFDLDNDGVRELFLTNLAPDNKEDVSFRDSSSYLTVFSKNLNYQLTPFALGGRQSQTTALPYITATDTTILAMVSETRLSKDQCKLFVFDKTGRLLKEKRLPDLSANTLIFMSSQLILFDAANNKTRIRLLNDSLEYKKKLDFDSPYSFIGFENLDADSNAECLAYDPVSGNLIIFQDDFQSHSEVKLTNEYIRIETTSVVQIADNLSLLSIDTSIGSFHISYRKNPSRNYRIPIFLLIYSLSFILLFLLQRIFLYRNNRKKMLEDRMVSLQLQSVMNQLNPHFTFNAINTIGEAILQGNREEAYENFTKLSNLIRSSMTNAFQLNKSLQEEIEFVKQYLEIEKYRFGYKLSYTIRVNPSVDLELKIPKMLIHIFVENAIKHGIFHKSAPGNIGLLIEPAKTGTLITIADDGVGRTIAKSFQKTGGKGLIILDSYLSIFKKSYNVSISYTIEDLHPDQINCGTKVIILIAHSK